MEKGPPGQSWVEQGGDDSGAQEAQGIGPQLGPTNISSTAEHLSQSDAASSSKRSTTCPRTSGLAMTYLAAGARCTRIGYTHGQAQTKNIDTHTGKHFPEAIGTQR